MCFFKSELLTHGCEQILHLKGLSSLWIFSCLVSRLDAGKTESNKVIEKRSQCIQFVRGVRALVWNMIVCVILIFCALRTIRRVDDWHSNETLFQSALKVYPDNARMNNNVGTIYHGL